VRSWTLDETGLDNLLLFDGSHLRIGGGLWRPLMSGPVRPLTVDQRLGLQRQLARAEFLARLHHGR
jgi:hypothetical protein